MAVTTTMGIARQGSWRAELGDELEAVHLRHHQVQQDHARRNVAQALEGRPAVLRLHDGVPLRLQHAAQQLAHRDVVVHDQHGKVAAVLLEHGDQALAVDGLGEVVGGAEGIAEILVVDDGQHDDGDVGDLRVGLERREHRPAVHSGHHDVQRDGVGLELARAAQTLLAAEAVTTWNPSLVRKRCIRSRTAASSSMTRTVPRPAGSRPAGSAGAAVSSTASATTAGSRMVNVLPRPCFALDGDVAAHHPAEPAAERQAEAGAAVLARGGGVGLGESLEELCELLGGHADAGVAHAEDHEVPAVRGLARHGQGDGSPSVNLHALLSRLKRAWRTFVRSACIAPVSSGQRTSSRFAFFAASGWITAAMSLDQAGHVEALEVQLHLAGLDLGEVEDVVDELEQMLAGRVDLLEIVRELLGAEVGRILLEHLAVADDGVERRAQLVGHVGQELGLVAVGLLELAALVFDLAEEPGVLDRHGRLGGERLEEVDHLRRELAWSLLGDGEPADRGDPRAAGEWPAAPGFHFARARRGGGSGRRPRPRCPGSAPARVSPLRAPPRLRPAGSASGGQCRRCPRRDFSWSAR